MKMWTSASTVPVKPCAAIRLGHLNAFVPRVTRRSTTAALTWTNVKIFLVTTYVSTRKDLILVPVSPASSWPRTEHASVSKPRFNLNHFHKISKYVINPLCIAGVVPDIDECSSNPCAIECINTPGSYSCLCPFGYQFVDNICQGEFEQLSLLFQEKGL